MDSNVTQLDELGRSNWGLTEFIGMYYFKAEGLKVLEKNKWQKYFKNFWKKKIILPIFHITLNKYIHDLDSLVVTAPLNFGTESVPATKLLSEVVVKCSF